MGGPARGVQSRLNLNELFVNVPALAREVGVLDRRPAA